MFTRKKIAFYVALAALAVPSAFVFARGGGGGSGGGGGGGGFGGGFSGSSGGTRVPLTGTSAVVAAAIQILVMLGVLVLVVWTVRRAKKQRKQEQARAATPEGAAAVARVREVFPIFENGWASMDVDSMKPVVSTEYFKRMVLELSVLKAQGRQDKMENLALAEVGLVDDVTDQNFRARVFASATDILWDTAENRTLFVDSSPFTEYWRFIKEEGVWKLDGIDQQTANVATTEQGVADFASRNNFYYDPDFGWLMLPNKGTIFSSSSFGNSDVNNHVIGWYREKIVEFYTYIPVAGKNPNWLVAQAILPKTYNDVLIRQKRLLDFAPKGLSRITLESAEFNEKFDVFTAPGDEVSSLELLAPNFMEKVQSLPFELNIELIGPFLYFYTKDRGTEAMDDMLQIISWAFDEMKL